MPLLGLAVSFRMKDPRRSSVAPSEREGVNSSGCSLRHSENKEVWRLAWLSDFVVSRGFGIVVGLWLDFP